MVNFFTEITSNYYYIVSIAIIISLIGVYFIWKNVSSNNVKHDSNREHNSEDQSSNKTANLMLFYVDWCPHCKTAKPEWNELKEEYDGKNINGYTIVFEEYNCTTESPEIGDLIQQYKIDGYPTIKLVKDGQVIEYDAKPTKSTLEQFLTTVL